MLPSEENLRYRPCIENLIISAGMLEAVIKELKKFDPGQARSLELIRADLNSSINRLKQKANYDEDL